VEEVNLWEEVRNECIRKACEPSKEEKLPDDETTYLEQMLVKTKFELGECSIKWVQRDTLRKGENHGKGKRMEGAWGLYADAGRQ
jgi:hypothetical protein